MRDDAPDHLVDVRQEIGVRLHVGRGHREARKVDVERGFADLRRQADGVLRHDHGNDQLAGQRVPRAALGLDHAHRGIFAPRVGMGLVLGRVDQHHARAFAQRAGDLAVEVVTATELFGVDEQFVFVVEIRFEVTAQCIGQRGLEALHQLVPSMGIAEKAAITYRHCSPLKSATGRACETLNKSPILHVVGAQATAEPQRGVPRGDPKGTAKRREADTRRPTKPGGQSPNLLFLGSDPEFPSPRQIRSRD
ncbi:conserved hypothetical protein [Ricinus communis]|uniref:Uncharacterized protein n=1 Tax=Ricinus communis TaxID=3988 RepID=B9TL12_RICCO|nr:conserved hypothetical protein [Ricinus communis]